MDQISTFNGGARISRASLLDPRLASTSLLLTAGDFADTVWAGRATQHIRAAFANHIELEQLKRVWAIISPSSYLEQYRRNGARLLIVSGRRDKVVPFEQTEKFFTELRAAQANVDWRVLSCGHYTLARFPFNLAALFLTAGFMRRN
jgi:fermentation-respiration switch protein FrsA (DUF1100 family)